MFGPGSMLITNANSKLALSSLGDLPRTEDSGTESMGYNIVQSTKTAAGQD